jgi:conjugative relaxase-like TrwC/TraI family protein
MISASQVNGSGYYSEALSKDGNRNVKADNYYANDRSEANYFGRGAEELGIKDLKVDAKRFDDMLHGKFKNENTGETSEMKRTEKSRLGWDFTISAPKSVSIAGLVHNDKRVIDAHDKAVEKTLAWLEQSAEMRVRRNGSDPIREQTSNITGASFKHYTSRDNDPQIHTHNVIFNRTYGEDGVNRTLEPKQMYRDLSAADYKYKQELTSQLKELGYDVKMTKKDKAWDIDITGIDQKMIDAFSRRSTHMDAWKESREQTIQNKISTGVPLSKEETRWTRMDEAQKNQWANLENRKAKSEVSQKELQQEWRQTAKENGFRSADLKSQMTQLNQKPQPEKKNGWSKSSADRTKTAKESLGHSKERIERLQTSVNKLKAQKSGIGRANVGKKEFIGTKSGTYVLDKSLWAKGGLRNRVADSIREKCRSAKQEAWRDLKTSNNVGQALKNLAKYMGSAAGEHLAKSQLTYRKAGFWEGLSAKTQINRQRAQSIQQKVNRITRERELMEKSWNKQRSSQSLNKKMTQIDKKDPLKELGRNPTASELRLAERMKDIEKRIAGLEVKRDYGGITKQEQAKLNIQIQKQREMLENVKESFKKEVQANNKPAFGRLDHLPTKTQDSYALYKKEQQFFEKNVIPKIEQAIRERLESRGEKSSKQDQKPDLKEKVDQNRQDKSKQNDRQFEL